MIKNSSTVMQLQRENAELRSRMAEVEETLRAIHSGEVDALVVSTEYGEKIFTLEGADYLFRMLIENMSEGAITVTTEGVILFSNQRFAEMLKRPLEQVIGSSLMDLVTSADRGNLEPLLVQIDGKRHFAEINLVSSEGTLIPTQISLMELQKDDMHDMQGVICMVVTDLTERVQAETTLRESEMRYRSVVENANEAIVIIQDGRVKFINPFAEKIFGKNTPFQFNDFVHPEDRHVILRKSQQMLTGDKLNNLFNYRLIACDGSIMFVEENSVKIKWEGRSAILALITDVTEIKKMEEEILRADKLESIGLLAGGIAHDFNNYLAILLGNVSLVKLEKDHSQKVLDRLTKLEKTIMSAKELSNQFFTFATGGSPVKEQLDIKPLILDNVTLALSGSNIRPQILIAEELYMVEADKGQFSQVLNNLIINAVQAMPQGGTLDVRAENITLDLTGPNHIGTLTDGPYLKITIKDEGTGIPLEYMPKIFDPFFTTKDKGRGLGLTSSYSIIRNHGGHLSVESEIGTGTSFYIFLPAVTDCVGTSSAAARSNILKGKGKILVMDDEEDLLAVTFETLSAIGYNVVLARNGKEAIKLYLHAQNNEQPFDLVIMDLTITGGMGGKDAITELLKIDPKAKVIVSSGYSNDQVMSNFKQYGFVGVLRKPFTIEDLSMIVFKK